MPCKDYKTLSARPALLTVGIVRNSKRARWKIKLELQSPVRRNRSWYPHAATCIAPYMSVKSLNAYRLCLWEVATIGPSGDVLQSRARNTSGVVDDEPEHRNEKRNGGREC